MAKSRRLYAQTALVALFSTLAACENTGLEPVFQPEVDAFVGLMNDYRVSVGCEPLTWISEIADVAEAHSLDMVQRDFFDHMNPDGASPFDRLRAAGLSYSRGAENIALGAGSADQVLEGWLASDGHRANISNCALTEHGVGLSETRWTHLFRTP